ncbi:restriction endonuclease [Candidatus Nomurabacteria bacterium]|nr:restriction endonuclease [Candidatus Nomurabacteria bacterium]
MSRRRNTRVSPAEELFSELVDLSSLLPWWLSITVALLLFFLVPFSLNETFSVESLPVLIFKMFFGIFLKYFLPLAMLLGGILNLFKRGKAAFMFRSLSSNGVRETLNKLSWQDFEFLLSEWFKKQGYGTELVGGGGADGGFDIKLHKDGGLYLVQCKHYKTWKVSVKVVRELYGVMAAEGAVGGFVITTGRFTKDAKTFANDNNVILLDGDDLEHKLDSDLEAMTKPVQADETKAPEICPRCGHELVVRNGKRGKFWGCSSFLQCRFTKDLN